MNDPSIRSPDYSDDSDDRAFIALIESIYNRSIVELDDALLSINTRYEINSIRAAELRLLLQEAVELVAKRELRNQP